MNSKRQHLIGTNLPMMLCHSTWQSCKITELCYWPLLAILNYEINVFVPSLFNQLLTIHFLELNQRNVNSRSCSHIPSGNPSTFSQKVIQKVSFSEFRGEQIQSSRAGVLGVRDMFLLKHV